MQSFDVKEIQFEKDIEEYLIRKGGYKKGNPKKFDRKLGLDCDTFIEFIKTSQERNWEKYKTIYGNDAEKQIVS